MNNRASRFDRIRVWLSAAVFSALILPSIALAQNADARVKFSIPAQTAPKALETYARQAGIQILFPHDQVAAIQTQELRGEFTRGEALSKLLDGTGLKAEYVSKDVVSVRSAAEAESSSSLKPRSRLESGSAIYLAQQGQPADQPIVQAQAGERRPTNAPPIESPPATDKPVQLEGIVVTATKRQERLIDVPISVGVVTKDDIERRGLASSEDYLRGMPGVSQVATSYNSGQSIVIRGIETTPSAQNFGVGPVYGSYFGETPTTTNASLTGGTSVDLKVVDVDRVEVLRGPQGTAFGDASLGGAVRTIPTPPKFQAFEGKVGGELSDTGGYGGVNHNVQGVLNVPLVQDHFAIRGVAYEYSESGYYRNRAGSDPTFQSGPVTQYSAQANAVDKDNVGATYIRGARLAAAYRWDEDVKLTLNYIYQKNEQDGVPIANSDKFDQTMYQLPAEQAVRGQTGGFSDQYVRIANPVLEWNLGWADLVATYSGTRSGSANLEPYGIFGSNLPLSQGQAADQRGNLGEIRIASHLGGSIDFLAGVFAENIRDDMHATYYWYGSAASNTIAGGIQGLVSDIMINRRLTQKSVFGEVNWRFLSDFLFTAGARYYDYERVFEDVRRGPLFGNSNFNGTVSATGTSPRANLSYRFGNDAMVYAGYSEGFRLGTPQPPLPARCDANNDGILDGTGIAMSSAGRLTSDTIKNYEIGAKGAFGTLSVDGAVFHMIWEELPVRVLAPCLVSFQANAGNARSDGVELNVRYRISPRWLLTLGASYADARLTTDVPALGAKSGNQLPGSPKYNANLGLQYSFEAWGYKSFARADYVYLGTMYGDLLESARIKTDPYGKLDLTAGAAAGHFDFAVFVRNATNEDAFFGRGTSPGVPPFYGYRVRPRTIGARLNYNF